jgi:hypothetical protein
VSLNYSDSPGPNNNNPESANSLFSLTSSPGTNEDENLQTVNEFTTDKTTENITITKLLEGTQGDKEGTQGDKKDVQGNKEGA